MVFLTDCTILKLKKKIKLIVKRSEEEEVNHSELDWGF